jgi:hypothetical protein
MHFVGTVQSLCALKQVVHISLKGEVNVPCSIHTLMQGFILSRVDMRPFSEQVAATQFPEIEPTHALPLILRPRPDRPD